MTFCMDGVLVIIFSRYLYKANQLGLKSAETLKCKRILLNDVNSAKVR